jgi:hypothetical protein
MAIFPSHCPKCNKPPVYYRILGDAELQAWLECPHCRLASERVDDYGVAYKEWEKTVTRERNHGRGH